MTNSPRVAAASAILFGIVLLVPPSPVAAAAPPLEIEGVRFDRTIQVMKQPLQLRGAALQRYKILFKAFVAALYLPPGADSEGALSNVPKRLEIEYFWPIPAADFASITIDRIAMNVPSERLASLRTRIARFNDLYSDVQPGDRYSLTYLPGVGTQLALNGVPLGTAPGADFAAAIFSIWLGDNPLDAGLKTSLLGE
jgi:hypothetical protein